jgi:predicted lipoprotein with Yx(FWY)xxD motif
VTRSRPITFLASAAVAPLVARAVAGCGSGGATASPPPAKTVSARAATAGVASTGLWKILFDSKGRTLYLFQKDSGTKTTCSGACASAWPPLRAKGKPTAGRRARTADRARATAAAISPGGVAEEWDDFFRAPDDQGRDAQLGDRDSRRSGCPQSNCKSV